jgi:predicted metalloprotease with PDZ domain
MLQYIFSFNHAHRHFLDIEFHVDNHRSSNLVLQLPSWRPGRYELGDFAKNIQYFKVHDMQGNPLAHKKISKDTWLVSTLEVSKLVVSYNYYSNELNAGSTYLDEKQLYVNPVNCCLYIPNRITEPCKVDIQVPKDYKIACALSKKSQFVTENFDQLAESPWIASESLQYQSYTVFGVQFYIWFQGDCLPDWNRILKDFKAFTKAQMKDFTSFPVKEYHFINQIVPYKGYHGVEHTSSSIIYLGPGAELMSNNLYTSLLGVSSHELYHTWNIKQIRPQALLPYDYSKENYSRMGYLYEGVTTYMGDLYLMRSKVFSISEFYKTQEENLDRHFHNSGRFNMSVAESSFDTWLDGYQMGIPHRKVSIYKEGALCAFMLDVVLLEYSQGELSLRDLMDRLYVNYALKGKGITEEDYFNELVSMGGEKAQGIISNYMYGTKDFTPGLKEAFSLLGLRMDIQENINFFASRLGIKGTQIKEGLLINQVLQNSISDKKKIAEGDLILKINGEKLCDEVLQSAKLGSSVLISLKRRFETIDIRLAIDKQSYFQRIKIYEVEQKSKFQALLYDKWIS